MKLKDYDKSIEVMDKESADILEKLDGMDASSDEYKRTVENLKTLQEAKQIEVRNKSEHLSGKVPGWATAIFGSVLGVLFGGIVLKEERKGGVVSSQAIALWDRVIRKF